MSDDKLKEYLKRRRLELGMTVREVGKIVGVNPSTVTRWEKGDIDNMGRDKVYAYAKALQISPSIIMGWEEPPNGITTELTNYEEKLLQKFRALSADKQHTVELMINALYLEVQS